MFRAMAWTAPPGWLQRLEGDASEAQRRLRDGAAAGRYSREAAEGCDALDSGLALARRGLACIARQGGGGGNQPAAGAPPPRGHLGGLGGRGAAASRGGAAGGRGAASGRGSRQGAESGALPQSASSSGSGSGAAARRSGQRVEAARSGAAAAMVQPAAAAGARPPAAAADATAAAAAAPSKSRTCASCGKGRGEGVKLRVCNGCHGLASLGVRYCSVSGAVATSSEALMFDGLCSCLID